jgi:hypothetical protein
MLLSLTFKFIVHRGSTVVFHLQMHCALVTLTAFTLYLLPPLFNSSSCVSLCHLHAQMRYILILFTLCVIFFSSPSFPSS